MDTVVQQITIDQIMFVITQRGTIEVLSPQAQWLSDLMSGLPHTDQRCRNFPSYTALYCADLWIRYYENALWDVLFRSIPVIVHDVADDDDLKAETARILGEINRRGHYRASSHERPAIERLIAQRRIFPVGGKFKAFIFRHLHVDEIQDPYFPTIFYE